MMQLKPKLKRNSPGRPRLRYKGLAIVMRLPPDELKALDRWIKADGALLSRQQAIRRISASRWAKEPRKRRMARVEAFQSAKFSNCNPRTQFQCKAILC